MWVSSTMFINDVLCKEDFQNVIVKELRSTFGVKYRKDKKGKNGHDKHVNHKVFQVPLNQTELVDVVLTNGCIVQIPVFVADACQRIQEHIQTEGLFRKAGSTARQREIRSGLESGNSLGRSHHVIDVANLLKLFFRELPEPLIPQGTIQDAMLQCLLCEENNKEKALLLICLLLPPLNQSTLAFVMQFLKTVANNSEKNKMTVHNLAIIMAPSIMPLGDIIGPRLNLHVRIIEMLIEHSSNIGVIPEHISVMYATYFNKDKTPEDKKKKKRRSGSLTRMFVGLRKIVGGKDNVEEELERTPEKIVATPCLNKSNKKRKVCENGAAFSAKKKKDLLAMMPDNGGLLPCTPVCIRPTKKSRLSIYGRLVGKDEPKNVHETEPVAPSLERRWSINSWHRNKKSNKIIENELKVPRVPLSPVVSMPCLVSSSEDITFNNVHVDLGKKLNFDDLENDQNNDENLKNEEEESYLRIPKSEYEAIKEKISAIETRISQEFGTINSMIGENEKASHLNGPEKVLDKYEKTLEETETLSSTATDKLAKRLSRELKIRRSTDNRVVRSPSARKIGSIRRRSQENVRLSRQQTWHLGNTKPSATYPMLAKLEQEQRERKPEVPVGLKSNLKRGRPNTIQSGLHCPQSQKSTARRQIEFENKDEAGKENQQTVTEDEWTSGEKFFADPANNIFDTLDENETTPPLSRRRSQRISTKITVQEPSTPRFVTTIHLDKSKTPMLPPAVPPKKTPVSVAKQQSNNKSNRPALTPVQDQQNGRASIARLRRQNAGMVLAKAKLFDGMSIDDPQPVPPKSENARRRQSCKIGAPRAKEVVPERKVLSGNDEELYKARRKERQVTESPRPKTPNRRVGSRSPRRQRNSNILSIAKSSPRCPKKFVNPSINAISREIRDRGLQKYISENCSPSVSRRIVDPTMPHLRVIKSSGREPSAM